MRSHLRLILAAALVAAVCPIAGEAFPSSLPLLGNGGKSPNYTAVFVAGLFEPSGSACGVTAVSTSGYGFSLIDGSTFPQNCGSYSLVSSTLPSNLTLKRIGVTLVNESTQQANIAVCGLTATPTEASLINLHITGPGGSVFFDSAGKQEGFLVGSGSFAGCVQWGFTFLTPMSPGTTYTAAISTDGSWH